MRDPDRLELPASMLEYYEKTDEAARLLGDQGFLEFERTKAVISGVVPPPPARVLDVGGGTGHYASWLAAMGYDVSLSRPLSRIPDIARSDRCLVAR